MLHSFISAGLIKEKRPVPTAYYHVQDGLIMSLPSMIGGPEGTLVQIQLVFSLLGTLTFMIYRLKVALPVCFVPWLEKPGSIYRDYCSMSLCAGSKGGRSFSTIMIAASSWRAFLPCSWKPRPIVSGGNTWRADGDADEKNTCFGGGKREVVRGRKLPSQVAVRRMGYSGAEVGRFPGLTTSAVNRLVDQEELTECANYR